MKTSFIQYIFIIFSIVFLCMVNSTWAEDGVTDSMILIGTLGPSGSLSADDERLGLEIAIKEINEQGDIHGRKLELRSHKRSGGMMTGLDVAKRLVEEDKVFCLFNFGGTPLAAALTPYVTEKKVPYLFPHQGGDKPTGKRYIFTSYPLYKGECNLIARYLSQVRGFKKIGIIYADNAYGHLLRDKYREHASKFGYEMMGEQPVKDRAPADLMKEMEALKKAEPDALILALYVKQAQIALEAKRALGWKNVTLVSSGPLTDEKYLNLPGEPAEGTIGLSLYPDPVQSQEPGVVAYRRALKKYSQDKEPNRYSLYGYVYAKLMAEGLKRAGRDLTREGFIDAMETIKNWESGGIIPPVSFSKTDHHAQTAAFIAELKRGKFQAITKWFDVE